MVLISIGFSLFLIPGVQKKIFLKILDRPGIEINIEHIKIGWGEMKMNSFHFSQNGIEINFDTLKVELLALSLLTKNEINLNHLTLTGLKVILPHKSQPKEIHSIVLNSKLEVDTLQGSFILKRIQSTYEVHTPETIHLKNIFYTHNGRLLLKEIEIATLFNVAIGLDSKKYLFTDLNISSKETLLTTGECRVLIIDGKEQQPLVKAEMELNGSLPSCLEQPLLSSFKNIEGGKFSLTGHFKLNNLWSANLKLQFEELKLHKSPTQIPIVEFDFTGHLDQNGTVDLNVPFIIEGAEGISDGSLQLSSNWVQNRHEVDALLIGKHLYLSDIILLSSVYQPIETSSFEGPISYIPLLTNQPSSATSHHFIHISSDGKQPDMKPFWSHYSGQMIIDYKRININSDCYLDNLVSEIHIDNEKISIKDLGAIMYKSPFHLKGTLKFFADNPELYFTETQAQLSNFDIGEYLAKRDPNSRPVLEAVVNITSNLQFYGLKLDNLLNKAQGQLTINSTKGIFRTLDIAGDNIRTGADLLSTFGSLLGNKVRELRTADRLANFFRNIHFDSFKIEAIRDKNLDIHLTDLFVKNQDIHLIGQGLISYQKGVPILDQPIKIKSRFSAKNEVANFLQKLTLLKNRRDNLGYKIGPSFFINGSLNHLDFSDLYRVIFQASKNTLSPKTQ